MDWLRDLEENAKAKLGGLLKSVQGEIHFGGDQGTTGSVSIGAQPGLPWPWVFAALLVIVFVLAWRK